MNIIVDCMTHFVYLYKVRCIIILIKDGQASRTSSKDCNWYSIDRETMLKSKWQEDKRIGRDQNNYIINNRHETIHDH